MILVVSYLSQCANLYFSGKTTVALALANIFGFGHTQSDDVSAKKPAPIFVKNVQNLLQKHDVVIADKNNHLQQHRGALRDATRNMHPPVRLLALNWPVTELPQATVHRVCGDRVSLRGSNHQTLRADAAKSHEGVIWMFLTQFQELSDAEVDEVVDMDLEEDSEASIRRAVAACVRILGVPPPSEEKIQRALRAVGAYKPKITKSDEKKSEASAVKPPRYFGLLAEVDLDEVLAPALVDVAFYAKLKEKNRVTQRPHVTIVHQNSLPDGQELWDRCSRLHQVNNPPTFKFRLGSLLWNDRVMAVTVEDLEIDGDGPGGDEFVQKLGDELKRRLHITVGTRDANVPAVEAKDLVEKWRSNGLVEGVMEKKLDIIRVKARVKGLFN